MNHTSPVENLVASIPTTTTTTVNLSVVTIDGEASIVLDFMDEKGEVTGTVDLGVAQAHSLGAALASAARIAWSGA